MSLRTRICREYYFFRSSSAPYLSGDSFRRAIKARIEGSKPNFADVSQTAETIFCEADHVAAYLRYRQDHPGAPFVLVSHNGDVNFREDSAVLLPPTLRHWFGQNILFRHERVSPLPIGLENRFYGNSGSLSLIAKIKARISAKDTKLFYSFNVGTNRAERERALAAAKAHPLGVGSERRIPVYEFQSLLASVKFVVSPPGNGFDCHRTWEALYFKTIPIVKKSYWSDFFVGLGLPLLCLDAWEELGGLSASFLDAFYAENRHKFDAPALYLPYWLERFQAAAAIPIGS